MNSSLELSSQDDSKSEQSDVGLTLAPPAISAPPESANEIVDLPSSEGDGGTKGDGKSSLKSQWDDSGNERKRQRCDGQVRNNDNGILPSNCETSTYLPPVTAQDSLASYIQGGDTSSSEPRPPQHQPGDPLSFSLFTPQQQGILQSPIFAAATAQAILLSQAGHHQNPGSMLGVSLSSFTPTYPDTRNQENQLGDATFKSDRAKQSMGTSETTDLRGSHNGGVGMGSFGMASPYAMYNPMSAGFLPTGGMFVSPGLQGVPSMNSSSHQVMMNVHPGSMTLPVRPPAEQTRQTLPSGATANGASLYMPMDEDVLAENQILVRKQIEFFAAGPEDVDTIMSGRRRPIAQGQVGIRCRHCAHLPLKHRKKAAIYYPARLKGIYQAAQNMNVSHLAESCMNVDNSIRTALVAFQQKKGTTGHGGKDYWSQTATAQGVYEIEGEGLRFVGTDTVPNANFQAL